MAQRHRGPCRPGCSPVTGVQPGRVLQGPRSFWDLSGIPLQRLLVRSGRTSTPAVSLSAACLLALLHRLVPHTVFLFLFYSQTHLTSFLAFLLLSPGEGLSASLPR